MADIEPLCAYRLWVYTSPADKGDGKGDVGFALHGTVRTVTLDNLHTRVPRQGQLFVPGKACELYVDAEDAGTLRSLTVAYDFGGLPDAHPWHLLQVIVRSSTTGHVRLFVAEGAVLRGPRMELDLAPTLSWYEDRYGNCTEHPPAAPPANGRWLWPVVDLVPEAPKGGGAASQGGGGAAEEHGSGADAERIGQLAKVHYQLWEALCQEEVAPLVDAALEDLRLERTPGTLLHACMQAAAGNPHANQRATAEQLQRDNASLQLALTTLRAQEEQRASAAELAGKDRERLLEQQRENERLKAQLAEQTKAPPKPAEKTSRACVIS